ncbi:MAG: serine hydrolase [Chloroflexi bacterium]|nr:serine hydrolase [Chloroflexota bacterium]
MNNRLYTLNMLLIVAFLLGGMTTCSRPSGEELQPAYWPTQGWRSTLPEEQGMDSAELVRMFEYVEDNNIDLHSLLIVRNGFLVMEAYWHPYGPNDRHSIESIVKTVTGTLLGIAIDRSEVKNTRQKLVDFFPDRVIQNMDKDKKSITLGNLLSMTPGLDCEDVVALGGMDQAGDWVQYFLDLPMSSKAGKKWIYCSGTSHLISAILQKETGMDSRTYANQNLFAPLGIPQITVKDWAADPQGITNGITGLYLTPRELAEYGYLYLNKGRWDGRQIVSSQWVDKSTKEQAYIGEDEYVGGLDRRFGYFWSIFPEQKYYGYLGRGGQELFVLPRENMVIVFTGAVEVGEEGILLNLINDYIVPSVCSESALPSNPEAGVELETFIQTAAGSKQPVPALPDKALNITDKTYKLEPNFLGWSDMTFHFEPGLDEATLTISGSPKLKIGLDNRYRLTNSPNSRPIGLRGQWAGTDRLYLDYIIFGDFIRSEAWMTFTGDEITITISYLNWNNPPIVLHGSLQK